MKKAIFLRIFGVIGMVFLLTMVAGPVCSAEKSFPNREIQIVIPTSAGGVIDLTCRVMTDELSKNFGVPVVVVNKAGGNDIIGMQFVAQSKPDGHTILAAMTSHITLRRLMDPDIPINIPEELIPVARLVTNSGVLVVRKDAPWKTLEELINYAKKNPGKVSFGTTGVGSSVHYNIEMLMIEANMKCTVIPYKGGGPLLAALIGGHVDACFVGIPAAQALVKSGDLRPLVTILGGVKGFPEFAAVPTLTEKGYPGSAIGLWAGLFLPKGVDKSVQEKISAVVKKTMSAPDVIRKQEEIANTVSYLDGEEFGREIVKEAEKLSKVAEIIMKGK